MSLLDKASLVVTPNAYKASKLYSVIPSDGSGDMTVVRATTATRINSAGLIESVAINIPRIDYTNGSCPSLLVEPQRTNLTLYSEQFDNAYWIKDIDVTVNSNVSISPSGNLDADRVNFASNNKAIYKNITATGAHRFSIYLKGEGSNIGKQIQLLIGNVGGTVNVTLTSQWQRFTTDASTSTYVGVAKIGALQADSVLIWGSQLEVGAYPTSYIPTVASSVTRNADVISKTGISSLIGQTEGTLFSDFNVTNNDLSNDKTIFAFDDNSYYVNIIAARILSSNFLNILFRANSVPVTLTNLPTITNGNHKIAIRYGNGFVSVFVDGVFRNTQVWTNSFTNSISQLFIGKNRIEAPYFNDRIKSVQVYKTALTDAECLQLTTL